MEKHKIDRINFLSRKAKSNGLSAAEAAEQRALREEYLSEFRTSFSGVLNNTYIKRPDGTKEKLRKKN